MIDQSSLRDHSTTSGLQPSDWSSMPLDCIRRLLAKLESEIIDSRGKAAAWVADRWQFPSSPWSFYGYATAIGFRNDVDDIEGTYEVKTARVFCLLLNLLNTREQLACAEWMEAAR